MPRFCILRRWWGCGRARNKFVWENLVICCVVECVSCFFRCASLCLLWMFSSKWSKCKRWGSGIVTGSDILFEVFQLANVEIVCAVDYFSCYCCCCWLSFGIECSLQCPCSRRTRTLSGPAIPVLECNSWRGTVVSVAAAVRSQKVSCDQYASKHGVLFNACTCISVFYS
jgi:hypothetical protein